MNSGFPFLFAYNQALSTTTCQQRGCPDQEQLRHNHIHCSCSVSTQVMRIGAERCITLPSVLPGHGLSREKPRGGGGPTPTAGLVIARGVTGAAAGASTLTRFACRASPSCALQATPGCWKGPTTVSKDICGNERCWKGNYAVSLRGSGVPGSGGCRWRVC